LGQTLLACQCHNPLERLGYGGRAARTLALLADGDADYYRMVRANLQVLVTYQIPKIC
jgi:hypothetical protein